MFHKFLIILCLFLLPEMAMAESLVPVTITSGSTEHRFQLEWADTPQRQEHGLMFRQSLAEDGGMLFHYDTPRQVFMWMRNTLIPLDMLFLRQDGTVAHIVESAEPHSEEPRGTTAPVTDVLELPGGTVKRLGIAVGDHVRYDLPSSH